MGNARYDYKCISCGTVVERDFRESTFTSPCDLCESRGEDRIQLYKRVYHMPQTTSVWHEHHSLATGQLVSDRRQFRDQLKKASDETSERFGAEERFVERGWEEMQRERDAPEHLVATHDRHVELGWKESKGTFVFPMSDKTK